MKLYHDYKKQSKAFSLFLLGILLVIPFVFSSAQTAQELNEKINQKNALQQTSTQIQPLHQIINPHQNIQHVNMHHDRINQQVIPYYPQNRPAYYQYPQPVYHTQQLYYYPNAMPMNESMLYVQRPQQQNPRILRQNIRK